MREEEGRIEKKGTSSGRVRRMIPGDRGGYMRHRRRDGRREIKEKSGGQADMVQSEVPQPQLTSSRPLKSEGL